jgi:DNA-binding NarL/FixJ family response regulator
LKTVLIVDGHQLMRLGLRTLLQARGFDPVIEAGSVAEALRQATETSPALVVADAMLPDGSGIELCRELRGRLPDARVVLWSESFDDATVAMGVRAGALGFLSKNMRVDDLCRDLGAIMAGEPRLDASATLRLLDWVRRQPRASDAVLTPYQCRVLALVARGKTNKDIGTALGVSERSIKNMLARMFRTLNISRRSEAAALFMRVGLLGSRDATARLDSERVDVA